jgi:alpha-ketoglutarate-dependent taurine dioxygenase
MNEASGSVLLQEIYELAAQSSSWYRHHWQQPGDALLWENGFTMHRREPFYPSRRRVGEADHNLPSLSHTAPLHGRQTGL